MMQKTTLGIFTDRADAEAAIDELDENGFNPKDMSIIMKDTDAAQEIGTSTGANVTSGAVTGATTGGVIGGLAGLLVGIGAITIPGLGALFIAGPLATALGLTGAAATTVSGAATGALAGGLIGALMGLGIPEDEARVYEDRIREGAILLAVPSSAAHQDVVYEILTEHGADQIRTVSNEEDMYEQPAYRTRDYDESAEYAPMGALGGRSTRAKTRRSVGERVRHHSHSRE